jgi:hypothetical protein
MKYIHGLNLLDKTLFTIEPEKLVLDALFFKKYGEN